MVRISESGNRIAESPSRRQAHRMKRWENAGYFLGGLVQSLQLRSQPPPLKQLSQAFSETEAEVKSAIKSVCAGTGVPDTLSPKGAYCLWARAMCALDFLGQILLEHSPHQEPRRDWTDTQVLEWLMTDLWERRSDHWLRLMQVALERGVPFYS
jgi:hypothetical protein